MGLSGALSGTVIDQSDGDTRIKGARISKVVSVIAPPVFDEAYGQRIFSYHHAGSPRQ